MGKRDILETGDSDTDNDSDRYRNEPGSGELHVGSPRRCAFYVSMQIKHRFFS